MIGYGSQSGVFAWPGTPGRSAIRSLTLMFDAWRTRRLLAELDPRLLKDVGLSRGEAIVEAERAPWDFGPRK